MLDWIFGKEKQEKKSEKKEEKQAVVQIAPEDQWAYDFIKQYLISPIWRNPLLDFMEENCLVFEDTEENKFQYTKIFNEFVSLCSLLLESITEETGISEKTLQQCIIKGINDKKDRKIFQQVLLCDNFMAFKKIMVAKNKELEIAAARESNVKMGVPTSKTQMELDEKEMERLQIEKAIAMSLALEEKAKQQQQKQLEEAIRQSQISAQKQAEMVESPKKKTASELPPLVIGNNRASKSIVQFKKQETKLVKQIESLKIKEEAEKKEQEDSEERKKRLLEQRQLIKKKKAEERKAELNAFVQNKPTGTSADSTESKVSEEELERRRKLMQRLKEQLKD